jgi:hypothetical protein
MRSVPQKRRQPTPPMQTAKRGRLDHRSAGRIHTPSKQVHLFSPPQCPPSPHHKPRASSPLRESAISPVVVIKRPEHRQPLGLLTVTLQGPRHSARRVTSKEFKLYEDGSLRNNVKSSPTREVLPTNNNDKENADPFSREKESSSDDLFVLQPRGPLAKLNRPVHESPRVIESKTIVVEEITSGYFVGAKIIREQKRTTSKETVSRRTTNKLPSLRRDSFNENWEFDIHQDEPGNLELRDYNKGFDNIMMEAEEDKENDDPGVSGDEINRHNRRESQEKGKELEDLS